MNAEADGPAKCPADAVKASDVAWECVPVMPPAGFTRENADAIVAKLDTMARPTMIQYVTRPPLTCCGVRGAVWRHPRKHPNPNPNRRSA